MAQLQARMMRTFAKELSEVTSGWLDELLGGLKRNPNFVEEPQFPYDAFGDKMKELVETAFVYGYTESEIFVEALKLEALKKGGVSKRTFSAGFRVFGPKTQKLSKNWTKTTSNQSLNWLKSYSPTLARVHEREVLEKVRNAVAKGVYKGMPINERMELIRRVSDETKKFSDHRLETIARTETMRASNMGAITQMKQSEDVRGVEFSSVMDERVTDICERRNGLWLRLDDPNLPSNTPPLHPNCRSILIPVTSQEVSSGWKGDSEELARLTEEEPPIQRDVDRETARRTHEQGRASDSPITDEQLQDILDASIDDLMDDSSGMDETGDVAWKEEELGGAGFEGVGEDKMEMPEYFTPAADHKEAEKFARQYLSQRADYSGVDIKMANALNESAWRHRKDYKVGRLGYLGTKTGLNKRLREDLVKHYTAHYKTMHPKASKTEALNWARAKAPVEAYAMPANNPASASPGFGMKSVHGDAYRGVVLNDMEPYKNIAVQHKPGPMYAATSFEESLKQSVKRGWFTEGGGTIKSLMDHEMGHILDYKHGLRKVPAIGGRYTGATHLVTGAPLPKNVKLVWRDHMKAIESKVSAYAMENEAEFIAEAWTEFLNNPNPRPVAKSIGELILYMIRKGVIHK